MDSLAKAYLLFSEQYKPLNEEVDSQDGPYNYKVIKFVPIFELNWESTFEHNP